MKKNLILGSGGGYSWYNFEPFVRSFVKNVQNTELVLFVNNISEFTCHQFETVNIGGGV